MFVCSRLGSEKSQLYKLYGKQKGEKASTLKIYRNEICFHFEEMKESFQGMHTYERLCSMKSKKLSNG